MSLSDHEQRVIKDLEGHLAASDPRLARMLSRQGVRRTPSRLAVVALASAAPGLVLLLIALSLRSVLLGVGAFLFMVAGTYVFTLPSVVRGRQGGGRFPIHRAAAGRPR